MDDNEYLKLFSQNNQQYENINETSQNNEFERLVDTNQNNHWENLNEIDINSKRFKNENIINDSWKDEFKIETRVNGVKQNAYSRNNDLNGLNRFIDDDDLRETVKYPKTQEILTPPKVDDINNVEIVSIDMFENINSNAMLTLANKKINQIDLSKVTNNSDDRQVTFLKS